MSVLSLPASSGAPSEDFLDKLRGLLKDRPCISLLGQIEFDAVDRIGTTGSVQLDQPELPYPASARAPEPTMIPRAAEMIMYLFVPTEIPQRMLDHIEEIYHATIAAKFEPRYVTVWYWWQVICLIMPSLERRLGKLLIWIGGLAGLKKKLDWIGKFGGS